MIATRQGISLGQAAVLAAFSIFAIGGETAARKTASGVSRFATSAAKTTGKAAVKLAVATVKEGALLGEIALIHDGTHKRMATVRAAAECPWAAEALDELQSEDCLLYTSDAADE